MNKPDKWVKKENAHPGIISKELFDQANATNSAPFAAGGRSISLSPYLLSGLITCSRCGFRYFGNRRTNKNVRYYEDSGYHSKGKAVCSFHAIPTVPLEEFVINTIKESLDSSRVAELLQEMIDKYREGRGSGIDSEFQHIQREIENTDGAMARLLDALQSGAVSAQTITPRIKELEEKQAKLQSQLEELRAVSVGPEEIQSAIGKATLFLQDFGRRLEEADDVLKKAILRDVVAGITVDREKDVVYCDILRVPRSANPALFKFFQSGVNQSRMCPEQDMSTLRSQSTRWTARGG
jgi:site-specific DNA recombinase